MVCLCEYEEGDILRTLPCFHSYHSGCIDEWLNRSKLCLLCALHETHVMLRLLYKSGIDRTVSLVKQLRC